MHRLIVIFLFSLVSITWGTTWIAMKIAVETIPPFFATGIRFLVASPLLIILSFLTKTPLLFPYGKRRFQIFISVFYFLIPFTLMLYGGSYVNSSISSIIFANMPVVVFLISHFYFKKKLNFIQKIGISIALITLICAIFIDLKSESFAQWKGILALLIALLSHAIIYVECQKRCCKVSVITFNALPSLISGVFLSILFWFIESPHIQFFSYRSILAIFYLGNFSGIFGILSYFYLQKMVNSFHASIVFLVFPLIAGLLEIYIYKKTNFLYELWFIFPLSLGILLTLVPVSFFKNFLRYLK